MPSRLEQLLKFHQLDPKDAFCSYGIAMEYIKAGDAAQALHWLDQTIAVDGDYAYAYFQKAKTLHGAGQSAAALTAIDAGLAAAGRKGDNHAAEELTGLRASLS